MRLVAAPLLAAVLVLASVPSNPSSEVTAQEPQVLQLGGPTSLTGTLHIIWGDPHPDSASTGTVLYLLALSDGRTLPLEMGGLANEAVALFNKRVVVNGRMASRPGVASDQAARQEELIVVESIALDLAAPQALQDPAADVIGTKKVIYLLVAFAGDAVPHPPSWYLDFNNPDTPPAGQLFPTTINGFYKKTSWNQFSWIGDVGGVGGVGAPGGWLTLPGSKTFYANCGFGAVCASLSTLSNDAITLGKAAGINFTVYDNINFVLSNDLDCCAWGGGYSFDGKSYGATWEPPWGQEANTYSHEFGHSLGLPHSGWVYSAYDSPWDTMSGGTSETSQACGSYNSANSGGNRTLFCSTPGSGFISAHKEFLGWIPGANLITTNTTSTVNASLEGLALPLGSAPKMIKICLPGFSCNPAVSTARYFTVEARIKSLGAPSQYDNAIPNDGVIIHDVRRNRPAIGGACFFNSQSGWAVPIDADPGDYDSTLCSTGGFEAPVALSDAHFVPGQTYTNGTYGFSVAVGTRIGNAFDVTVSNLGAITAAFTSPYCGSALSGTSTTFGWTTGLGALEYRLQIGTTGVGSSDIYDAAQGLETSRLVTGLPANSGPVYARLWTQLASGWQWNDCTFIAWTGAPRITGTVTSATDGAPVAGVSVQIYTSAGAFITSLSTNAQGGYTSPLLSTGSYRIRALPPTASGLLGQLHSNVPCPNGSCSVTSGTLVPVAAPNATVINFALATGGTITGTVTNASTATPIEGVVVEFFTSTGSSRGQAVTNAQGVYTSPGLLTGSYRVRANPSTTLGVVPQLYDNLPCAGGSCSVTSGTPVSVTAPNATSNINFALAPAPSITGTVTNASTLAPVAGVEVQFYSSAGVFIRSVTTNAQGVYTSAALSNGSYFVRAIPQTSLGLVGQLYNNLPCPGGSCTATAGSPVVVTAPSHTPNINFALPLVPSITGTVTNASTLAPVSGVTVQFSSSAGAFLKSVLTNAQGVYTSADLPTGSYFVRALPPTATGLLGLVYNNLPCAISCTVTSGTPVVVTAPNATTNINFALPPGSIITGTATHATTAAPVASVSIGFYSSTGAFLTSVSTNAQGAYTAVLSTGSYFLHASPPAESGLLAQLYNNIPCAISCTVTSGTPLVVTAPNATPNINFALVPGGRITGTVTNGTTLAPAASVSVQFYSSTGGFITSVSTDAEGAYTSPGLPTGSYFVQALPSTASGLVGQVYNNLPCPGNACTVSGGTPVVLTAPNATPNINFALVPGATITGTATNATTSAPVAGVTVNFYSSNGSYIGFGNTNAQGVYTSPALPTGSYFVQAFPPAASGLLAQLYNNLLCPNGNCAVTSGTPVIVTAPNAAPNINFALIVAPVAPNDTFATATVISAVPYQSAVNIGAALTSAEDPAVSCGNGSKQKSVWYLFTPAVTGPLGVNTFGSDYDTILSVYTGSVGSFSPVGCNDDSAGTAQSSLTVQATAGVRLAILVTSYSGSGGVLVLNVVSLPGAFGKAFPANGATGQSLSSTLSWGVSTGAGSYEYCHDTTNDNACGNWVSAGLSTSVGLVGLAANTTHYWHVRAMNGGGATYAEGATTAFWSFTTGASPPAFGQVDTPTQNAAGVQGAIGVTGWALDNVGVNTVQVFRNCLAFEPANCQTVLGYNVVYVGDAVFLAGARPDVAAAYPSYPNNTRAGWGYLMLTPLLPHVVDGQPFGGEGTLTLYAVATDAEGNKTLLGRTTDPASPGYATPTAITMSNSTIAKPFGAIDTPGQGQTIAGIFHNFGWALTPDSNTAGGDPDDIVIPTNGSTVTVFIDGQPTALVAYNQCRGNVGNPVPVGLFCNDDVASIFGNPTPLAPLTTRTSNPTLFRNLDAERAAIGAYTFDTTTLSDGMHTIAWSVTDSAGRTEGIGSRFFNVLNGAPSPQADTVLRAAPAEWLGLAVTLQDHAPVTAGVWGRMGFDLAERWKTMSAKDDGTYAVTLQELGRLELWLGAPVDAGYLVANDTLQPLPAGSSLTGSVFAWMPPPGYLGPYHLVFMRGGERIEVIVTVVEKARPIGK